ncbi:adenylyl-sulfate kinase [Methylobacterium sp. GC_Met_1]|uniref:adenylyl-sulfate kinase n=1 Tax=Methylobacterium sp. GC_Met_1 TaxID=2937377 RepID=UPI003211B7EC
MEVYVDTSVAVCEIRDPKGLYARARTGEISAFTGVSAPYEIPEAPDLTLRTQGLTVAASAQPLCTRLMQLCANT